MSKMCTTWCAIVACVIVFLSILATVQCMPLENTPAVSHNEIPTEEDENISGRDIETYNATNPDNFHLWSVERESGVNAMEILDREKRFPRIPIGQVCHTHRQCANTHCCAMKLGTPVCRQRPKTGQPCQQYSSRGLRPDTSKLFTFCPCVDGLTCRRRRSRPNPMNTRCISNSNCASTHCCAMKLGAAVCRRRPLVGQTCQDWTPLDTNALFSYCPCAGGLDCRRIPRQDVGICYASRR